MTNQETGKSPQNSICAVVVTYFPDQLLSALVEAVLPQVEVLLVVDNTPATASVRVRDILSAHQVATIILIENGTNLGIGAALNIGLKTAMHQGCQWLLCLDQDSRCMPDMVRTLLNVYWACEPRPAIGGGNYYDPRNSKLEVPVQGNELYRDQKTVITSGSLVDLAHVHTLGSFRADYFIDQLDHEFCLRARRHGLRVVITRKVVMEHSVGNEGGARLPIFGRFPNHSPLRKYYIARNSINLIGEYWRQEPEWCLRRLIRLLLGLLLMATLEEQRLLKTRAFLAGFMDGIRGRMGPCRKAWLSTGSQD